MNHKNNNNNGDDGAALINEVIEENPPRERGERDEWSEHVGWHRKEVFRKDNTLKLRGSTQKRRQQQSLNLTIPIHDNHTLDNSKKELSFALHDFYKLAPFLVIGTLFLRILMIFLCKRQEIGNGRKSR